MRKDGLAIYGLVLLHRCLLFSLQVSPFPLPLFASASIQSHLSCLRLCSLVSRHTWIAWPPDLNTFWKKQLLLQISPSHCQWLRELTMSNSLQMNGSDHQWLNILASKRLTWTWVAIRGSVFSFIAMRGLGHGQQVLGHYLPRLCLLIQPTQTDVCSKLSSKGCHSAVPACQRFHRRSDSLYSFNLASRLCNGPWPRRLCGKRMQVV